jgi:hypothetical protein
MGQILLLKHSSWSDKTELSFVSFMTKITLDLSVPSHIWNKTESHTTRISIFDVSVCEKSYLVKTRTILNHQMTSINMDVWCNLSMKIYNNYIRSDRHLIRTGFTQSKIGFVGHAIRIWQVHMDLNWGKAWLLQQHYPFMKYYGFHFRNDEMGGVCVDHERIRYAY